jgi:hypothetical protein
MRSVMAERQARRVSAAMVLTIAAALIGGCRLPSNALDGPLAVPLRITATSDVIEVDAPGWFASDTVVYLCPTEPPALPEPGPQRDGWTPGVSCHDYGHFAAADGLKGTLSLEALTDAERPSFDDASDWYLLVVGIEGARVTTAIHSRFSAPIRSAT